MSERVVPGLVITQVLIAIAALAVSIAVVLKIGPLIERKTSLEEEIDQMQALAEKLEQRIKVLEIDIADKQKEIDSAERILQATAEKVRTDSTARGQLESSIGSIDDGRAVVPLSIEDSQGFLVVLGSFKNINSAAQTSAALNEILNFNVRLFYAVSGYYTPVLGPFDSSDDARRALGQAKSDVPDAYIFSAGGFPFEIIHKNSGKTD